MLTLCQMTLFNSSKNVDEGRAGGRKECDSLCGSAINAELDREHEGNRQRQVETSITWPIWLGTQFRRHASERARMTLSMSTRTHGGSSTVGIACGNPLSDANHAKLVCDLLLLGDDAHPPQHSSSGHSALWLEILHVRGRSTEPSVRDELDPPARRQGSRARTSVQRTVLQCWPPCVRGPERQIPLAYRAVYQSSSRGVSV